MNDSMSPQKILLRLKDRATRLLAVRDHSEHELRAKLMCTDIKDAEITVSAVQVEEVIAWCHEQRWLDDRQFAGRYLQSRARKGYGPQRISQELAQKGISRNTVNQVLAECKIDWVAAARNQAERKVCGSLPTEYAQKVKLQRFLLYRGYYSEDIQNLYRISSD